MVTAEGSVIHLGCRRFVPPGALRVDRRRLALRPRVRRGRTAAVRRFLQAILAGALSLTSLPVGAQEAPAARTSGEALPLEYPPPSAKTTLALTGGAVFVGWYGLALGASFLEPDAPGASDLRIPVVGPWMAVAQAGCAKGNPDCSTAWVVVRAILQAMDGVGQAGGLAVIGEALFLPTRSEKPRVHTRAPRLVPVPFVAGDSIGLGLTGAF